MKELQKTTSIFIEKVSCHQHIKNTLLEMIDKCGGGPLHGVSKTDWNEPWEKRAEYWNYFFSFIHPYITNITMRLGKTDFKVVGQWYQQYYKNSKHGWHVHFRNQEDDEHPNGFAAVYFIELSDGLGTEFIGYPKIEYEEGDLVFFPSYLPHRSPINLTDKRKTVIAFNVNIGDKNDL
jgi:hypothetical protein